MEHSQSLTFTSLSQHPIPTANQNLGSASRQDHYEIWELYKTAQTYPRQDLTATLSRDNTSGSGLSSTALQQPSTKPFSGLPSRHLMTSPYREAGEAVRERPGIVYLLLPHSARPDTRLQINAALPEAAVFDRCDRPPTVVQIPEAKENRVPSHSPPRGSRSPRRQSSKRPWNCSSRIYQPRKHSPRPSHWCE